MLRNTYEPTVVVTECKIPAWSGKLGIQPTPAEELLGNDSYLESKS